MLFLIKKSKFWIILGLKMIFLLNLMISLIKKVSVITTIFIITIWKLITFQLI